MFGCQMQTLTTRRCHCKHILLISRICSPKIRTDKEDSQKNSTHTRKVHEHFEYFTEIFSKTILSYRSSLICIRNGRESFANRIFIVEAKYKNRFRSNVIILKKKNRSIS